MFFKKFIQNLKIKIIKQDNILSILIYKLYIFYKTSIYKKIKIRQNFDKYWYYSEYTNEIESSLLSPKNHYFTIGKKKGFKYNLRDYLNTIRFDYLNEISSYLMNIELLENKISEYKNYNDKKKYVIFSAISNNYDSIKLPNHISNNFDYIIYTEHPIPITNIWKIKYIPYWNIDKTRITRYVKTHPHYLLKENEIAVWIDHNIIINKDIEPKIEEFIKSHKAIATFYHPHRNSIYEEADCCIELNKDDKSTILSQIYKYKKECYIDQDLCETNVVFYNLKHKKLQNILNSWWAEIENFSRRDQLSFNYVLSKYKEQWFPILPKGFCARNSNMFTYTSHAYYDPFNRVINLLFPNLYNPLSGKSYFLEKNKKISSTKNINIDICINVHKLFNSVKDCINSILKNIDANNQKLIIIDDNSNYETQHYLETIQKKHSSFVLLKRNSSTKGYTKSVNQALSLSNSEIVIILNSNIIVTKGWAEKLALALQESNGAGIASPLSNVASYQSLMSIYNTKNNITYNMLPKSISPENMNKFCEMWSTYGYYPRVPLAYSYCMALSRNAINQLKKFDEINFPNGYGENNDLCFRAINIGIDTIIATNTYVYHKLSKSFPSNQEIQLMQEEITKLFYLHGKQRSIRAMQTMATNPVIIEMRKKAQLLYEYFRIKNNVSIQS